MPPGPADDHRVCMYAVSSGTTGRAKIIPHTEAHLYHQSFRCQWEDRDEVYLRPMSIEYTIAKKTRFFYLLRGSVSVLLDPARWQVAEACHAFGVTRLGYPPRWPAR